MAFKNTIRVAEFEKLYYDDSRWWHAAKNYYKHVKPDILLNQAGKNIIIDTKWKIVEDANPGDKDLKQLFVYNLLWDAEYSFLIYPGKFSGTKGAYVHFDLSAQKKNRMKKSILIFARLFL